MKKYFALMSLILILTSLLSACNEPPLRTVALQTSDDLKYDERLKQEEIWMDENNALAESIEIPRSALPKAEDGRVKTINLLAVGDIMVHRSQLVRASRGDDFDFAPSFEYIKPLIEAADYAFGNLETTLADAYGQRRIGTDNFYNGYSGYPCFNSPDILASDIKDAGFDLVSTANNHSYDSKIDGINRTISVLDDIGLEHTGTYSNIEDADALKIVEVEGVSFAVINYTYGLNGFVLDEIDDYRINHLDMYDEDRVKKMYENVKAAEQVADFVIVMLHYGNEYVTIPDAYYQRPIVDGLFDAGADIIFGGHPHVLQPFETREITRESGEVETGVVIYSLGNFISSQRSIYTNGDDTEIGLIFQVIIDQIDNHKPYISGLAYTPTYTHWSSGGIRVIPSFMIPEDIELSHYDQLQIEKSKTQIVEHMNSMANKTLTFDGLYYYADLLK